MHPDTTKTFTLAELIKYKLLTLDDLLELLLHKVSISYEFKDSTGRAIFLTLATFPKLKEAIVIDQFQSKIYAPLLKIQSLILLLVFLETILAIIISRLIAISITKSLKQLEQGIIAVKNANFDHTIECKSNNEIGRVAKEFNLMANKLSQYKQDILKDARIRFYFQRYLPMHLLPKLLNSNKNLFKEKPSRHRATIMFIDIADYTRITTQLSSKKTVEYLNDFFQIATGIIFNHDGTIDKFIGDCILALFGVPIPWPSTEKKP